MKWISAQQERIVIQDILLKFIMMEIKLQEEQRRIVYSRYYADGTPITDLNDRYVFYTYNHYNDFQEYLNYEGGWGEMFGNITGGGPISDYDPNFPPTPYVPSVRQSLVV